VEGAVEARSVQEPREQAPDDLRDEVADDEDRDEREQPRNPLRELVEAALNAVAYVCQQHCHYPFPCLCRRLHARGTGR
jgi:hypothetical protein